MTSPPRAITALSNPRVFMIGVAFLAPLVLLPQLLQLSAPVDGLHGHGYCYLWNPSLVALHVSTDALIALSYLAISLTLGVFVYRARRNLPFHWMFLAFGVFILACGSTHAIEILTLWSPVFWFSANVKIVTAIASLTTAFTLPFLIPAAERTLDEAKLSEARRQQLDTANETLRERQRMVERFIQALPSAVLVINPDGKPYFANRRAVSILGMDVMHASLDEQAAQMYRTATDHLYPIEQLPLQAALEGRTAVADDVEIRRGNVRTSLEISAAPIVSDSGQVVQAVAVFQDITERKTLERAFAQAQKMQAVGLLAGGIAHDFNNSLTAVYGYSDVLRKELPPDSPLLMPIDEIRKAADRASGLTRHLLAFSRKQLLRVEPLHIDQVLHDMEPMLRQLLPENIRLDTIFHAGGHLVTTDRSQIEQVVLNLAINARDAMEDGGRLLIETSTVTLDEEYVHSHVGARAGRHVVLAVTDTGIGMDAATQARIFEPFFTTKGAGGTGLGLATVYGVVKQSGGNVWVYSEPMRGTTLKVYLPVSQSVPAEVERVTPSTAPTVGSERILLVEDDPAIRQLCTVVLRQRGYTVDDMADGESAIAFAESSAVRIDLVVTDVVLPGLNGRRVAERVRAIHPRVKVLYISGYTENAIVHTGVLDPMVEFLPKPFTPTILVERVRLVLDSPQTKID